MEIISSTNLTQVHDNKSCPSAFSNAMFGTLRIVVTGDQKPMFNLSDVCRALDIRNAADTKKRLQKRGIATIDTPTRNQYGATVMQPMTYIDEANLYRCIFQSRKTEAEKFQTWVFEEVLPQIRQTGGFIPTKDAEGRKLTDLEIMCLALKIQQRTIKEQHKVIEDMAPKADYTDEVLDSVSCLTTTQIAKELCMSAQELNRKLCEKKVQYGQSGQYLLYADFARMGLAQNRTYPYRDLFGDLHTRQQLVWTERGRHFIHNLINNQITYKQ